MKTTAILASAILFASALLCAPAVLANDLDDGMGSYTDDSIASYDSATKTDKNIKFIIQKAKSQAAVARKAGEEGLATDGDNYQNSVVMGAGSNVHGDIYIIDDGSTLKKSSSK
jgi:hypothetical protein